MPAASTRRRKGWRPSVAVRYVALTRPPEEVSRMTQTTTPIAFDRASAVASFGTHVLGAVPR
ncbi:hypothetical protein QE370_003387 [Aeromicrobium sp. SORGH_AS981]|nr:hypothetical protein [Aeromicrobium sp. SORGH_AS_0981]